MRVGPQQVATRKVRFCHVRVEQQGLLGTVEISDELGESIAKYVNEHFMRRFWRRE